MKFADKLKSISTFTDAIMSHGDCGISKALASCIKIQLDGMDDQSSKKTTTVKKAKKAKKANWDVSSDLEFKQYLNTAQVADLIGRHSQTVLQWARDGKFTGEATPTKVGRTKQAAYRWDKAGLLEFMKDNDLPKNKRK